MGRVATWLLRVLSRLGCLLWSLRTIITDRIVVRAVMIWRRETEGHLRYLQRGSGAWQQDAKQKQPQDHDRPDPQPHTRHIGRHLQLPLTQVPSQPQKTGGQQQSHGATDIHDQQTETGESHIGRVRWDQPLADRKQGQSGDRIVDHPDSRCMGPMPSVDHALPPRRRLSSFSNSIPVAIVPCAFGLRRPIVHVIGRLALDRLGVKPHPLKQTFARSILIVIDQRAIPGQFVRRPPYQTDESNIDEHAVTGQRPLDADKASHRDQGDNG